MRPVPTSLRLTLAAAATAAVLAGCVEPPPADDAPVEVAAVEELDLDEPAAASVVRRAQEITVRIRSLGCERLGIGSGFVLPGGVVVTNRHVVEQPREVTLNTWDGRSLDAVVDGVAVDSDLAVLTLTDAAGLPEAELAPSPAAPGDPVIAVGYPGGGPATVTTGRVLDVTDAEVLGEPAGVIVVDAPIRQGNSGGPLLDEQGRVVGVVFALDVRSGNGFAVPVTTLLERLGTGAFTAPSGDC
ncbi:MAG: S1C family serine protease [Actinomycetes bacterium]